MLFKKNNQSFFPLSITEDHPNVTRTRYYVWLTSVARVGDKYDPTEEYTPTNRGKSRVIGSVCCAVHVVHISHFRRLYERFVEKSDGDDPSQSQMILNVG